MLRTTIIGALALALLLVGNFAYCQDDEINLDDISITFDDASGDVTEVRIDLGQGDVLGRRTLKSMLGDSRGLTVMDAASFAGARSLGDVLERVPGVDVRFAGGSGQLATAQIRGSRGNQILVLINGVAFALSASADLSTLPIGVIERVEVVRGPEAARFGSGALGGVINIVTVQPNQAGGGNANACPGRQETPTTEIYRSWFGSNSTGGASVTSTSPKGTYYFSHSQARNDFSFPRSSGVSAIRKNNQAYQQDFWAAWEVKDVTYHAGVNHLRRGVPGSAEFPTLFAKLGKDSAWLSATGNGWRSSLTLEHTRYTDPQPYLHSGAVDESATRLRLEYAAGTLAGLPGGWGIKPRLEAIDSNLYGTKSRLGLDISHAWDWIDAGKSASLELGAVASSNVGLDPVARIGAVLPLGAAWDIHAALGYSVRHPAFDELYLTGAGAVRGNPDLKPERVANIEAGLRWRGKHTSANTTVFYSDYRESIIFAPVSGYLVQAINTGPVLILGVEGLLDHNLAQGWWWRTAFTWLPQAEYKSGVRLTGRAKHHANSRLEYLGAQWNTALVADFTGELPADLFGSLIIPARTVVGLEASKQFDAGTLGLSISNLFDEHTRDSWNYPLPGREVNVTWRIEL